CHHYYSIPHGF
nr:immunoglobulin light chain junction region [Macaca mulatta]MPN91639.1 immunoglobulin light chain junction region [Macaca mulatta]MPN92021.1 immunoglobulin light chain junction region [Macaca mulatta]MPN92175.1 immunoglobulin light chain junction region [Macaca mulatta]MPN93315.1 immunoglobulin light chain junction region [Macaca mulatta]